MEHFYAIFGTSYVPFLGILTGCLHLLFILPDFLGIKMRIVLNIIKSLNSIELKELSHVINQFGRSVERLAVDVQVKEDAVKAMEHRKLRKREKIMLRKLRLQRAILTRYMAGYTLEQIGEYLNYHPKTIARYIRKYQTDLSILKDVDRDINRRKFTLIEEMAKEGFSKPQIVRKLHVSSHAVTAVGNIRNIQIREHKKTAVK